jgi:transposase
VIVSLGNAEIPDSLQRVVAGRVQDHIQGQANLFCRSADREDVRHWTDYVIRRIAARPPVSGDIVSEGSVDGVLLDEVQHETVSELGPALVALDAWNRLGFDDCLRQLGFNDRQRRDAAATVINRLVASVSEHRLDQWVSQTALPELLGEKLLVQGDDRYYRVSDKLLLHQKSIEEHIRARQDSLFSLQRSVLLYDLTNTHFEGLCRRNPKAKHGKNKQKRNDCRQVVIGMVFDGSGFELSHQVFEGNKSDSKSLIDMVESLDRCSGVRSGGAKRGPGKPIVILDGGIASRDNLRLLRQKGFSYLVNDSRQGRARYEQLFAHEQEFEVVSGRDKRPAVLVRTIEEKLDETGRSPERVVLCRSEARGEKERAIVSNAERRFLKELEKLKQRIIRGALVDKKKVERAVGRIQSRHTRIRRFYEVEIVGERRAEDLAWQCKSEELKRSCKLHGCYVLRTDTETLSNVQLWQLYITLTRAEEGFQCLKRDLGLRPNRHHKEDRVDGHIFITILAYQLMCYIRRKLEDAGDRRDWDTVRRVLRTHCFTTIILPTKDGAVYRIRKAAQPEECQNKIYQALGIDCQKLPVTKTKYHR